ncbi:(S)-2-hydroxy-acid oxidase [Fistulifera solaris]|uniref:(S)-2-hydroxy-acid oxidase n=1 Tax=Fistulifera solaris TaxID=1519565 RepID=A0A1Z5JU63_FISSO|nr:(S)-2-hydroxy-acid oxidase [Fistulifera solaris]|eukprot:GAX17406.1 (S)-2-hydroxy-acid oxidase [Fistulifera solaris]
MLREGTKHTFKTIDRPVCVNDFQLLAQKQLPKDLYDYLSSGADDEQTLNENRDAWKRWYLRPRVLRSLDAVIDTRVVLPWQQQRHTLSMPVFVSPAGVQALMHPDGECAVARACEKAGILYGLSQHATNSIEEVAAAAPQCLRYYQSYILKDREWTWRLIERALQAGYQGIFLTVDSVRFGYRPADARNGFNALPAPHRLVHYDDDHTQDDNMNSGKKAIYNGQTHSAWDQNSEQLLDTQTSWKDVRWLRERLPPHIPLIIKGIMTQEDAIFAVQAGADAVMVSNHGGRQVDGCLAAIDVLPEVAAAVGHQVPIFLDGGVRHGSDVVKALALGATAVGIGKPVFFSLAVGGRTAVEQMLQLLKNEIESCMALCGIDRISAIPASNIVTRHPSLLVGNSKL